MRAVNILLLLVAAAAVIIDGATADKTPRLSRRVTADDATTDDSATSRRRFSRYRARFPIGPRPVEEDEDDTDANTDGDEQFQHRSRGGATVDPIDVAPTAEAPTSRRGGRARGSGRRFNTGRRVSRQRGGTTTETPTSPTSESLSQPGRSQFVGRQQATSSFSSPSSSGTDSTRQRATGRAGSRFNLDAYIKETGRLPIADIGIDGLPGHSTLTSGQAGTSTPSTAPSSIASLQDQDVVQPGRRRGGGFSRTATTQIAVPRQPPRRRRPVTTSPSFVDDTPQEQAVISRDSSPIKEEDEEEEEAPVRRGRFRSGTRNALGRRGSRKRARVRPAIRNPVVSVEEGLENPRVPENVANVETSMKVPALLAAFTNLAPYGEGEDTSPSHPNGLADDIAIALPAHLPDELIGGRGGRSYLPRPGSQSLSRPAGASNPSAYLPEPQVKPSLQENSYLPTSNLPPRSQKPSYLPEPDTFDRPQSSLFDGLALPPVEAPIPKPQPAVGPAECSADPGAIRLELRFLRPCSTDADCGVNLACFSAAAPCSGAAESQESVCLPAMEAGAACSRDAHCASARCHSNVCL
ncbi:uncharacterized protein LOC122383781 [Amphibalanus amphitrite]|uniref:uncharacterized protein LOC122383781 n=1 Tax=Amphibalanus amphitrite TaxID=1232801 RepID=UPI001C91FA94|nr:uncharacterized protein LOC122383781 [Amphibalanus amphitrite]